MVSFSISLFKQSILLVLLSKPGPPVNLFSSLGTTFTALVAPWATQIGPCVGTVCFSRSRERLSFSLSSQLPRLLLRLCLLTSAPRTSLSSVWVQTVLTVCSFSVFNVSKLAALLMAGLMTLSLCWHIVNSWVALIGPDTWAFPGLKIGELHFLDNDMLN